MKQKVERFLQEQNMLSGIGIVAGISGGADSVCLLLVLSELSKQYGFPLYAVHVHHGIRKETADRDAEYVQSLCEHLGVSCRVYRENVPAEAEKTGTGLEEAGRALRYQRLYETAVACGAGAVAVAHHRDDNAETVLFRLIRGTGIRGMAGIPAVSRPFEQKGILLIRPLLSCSREEILAELAKRKVSYCTDESNIDDSYSRNRIRNRIMPELTAVNPGAAEHIVAFAAHAEALTELLNAEADRVYRSACRGGVLRTEAFENVPGVVRTEVLLRFMKELTGVAKDFTEVHAEAADRLLSGPVSRQLSLPAGLVLEKTYEGIRRKVSGEMTDTEIPLVPGEYPLEDGKALQVAVKPHIPGESVQKNKWIKWFDYDMINCVPVLRTRRTGDFFRVNKEGGTKLVREYFVGAKIPREKRDRILLVANGSEVLWIPGMRGTEQYYVTEQTERVLVLTVR